MFVLPYTPQENSFDFDHLSIHAFGTSATTTSSADATTGSPQAKSIGSRVSGLVSSLRGGNAQDTASQSNADDPPKTIGNRLSDLASSVLGRGANSSTSTFARASNLTSDEPPKTIGTRLSDAVSSVGTSLGTSLTKTLVGTKT